MDTITVLHVQRFDHFMIPSLPVSYCYWYQPQSEIQVPKLGAIMIA